MRLLNRLTRHPARDAIVAPSGDPGAEAAAPRSEHEVAVDRYRYLLRTAPAEAMEEVHAEALATLTPRQRRLVFEELSRSAAVADRPAADDPRTLARSATRSELRRPGFLERTLGPSGGTTAGSSQGGSLLGTVAGVVVGSAIADLVLPGIGDPASDVAGGCGSVPAGTPRGRGVAADPLRVEAIETPPVGSPGTMGAC